MEVHAHSYLRVLFIARLVIGSLRRRAEDTGDARIISEGFDLHLKQAPGDTLPVSLKPAGSCCRSCDAQQGPENR